LIPRGEAIASDIDANGLDDLAREIEDVTTKVCDNAKHSEVEALIPAAVEAWGGLDVLVNNAGISGPTAPVEKTDPDRWEAVTFFITRVSTRVPSPDKLLSVG
jgi:NAD(P)-dependent dehydrogenase (short-subunit alcohol dehydrogenase family)